MRSSGLFIFVLCCSIFFVGCAETLPNEAEEVIESVEVVEEEPIVEESIEPVEVPEIDYPYVFPLTGIGTEEEAVQRPVMVMVENSPLARPQSGLHLADIVYEILAEGEITRFVSVFQSESPEIIGPVRSIRPYFVEIGDGLDALIVHAGWSQEAMNMISGRGLPNFDEVYGDGAYYWRSDDRRPPHNLYTNTELIRNGAANKGYRETWTDVELTFADVETILDGDPANQVEIPYLLGYKVNYEFNEEENVYYRYMQGEAHKDRETDEQLIANNILIAEANHYVLDNVGRRDVDVHGPGTGYILQAGKVKSITWEYVHGIIRAFDENQQEIPLLSGKTWIHIVPVGSEIKIQ
ncbi:DUF3048 domain-containing protein [Chengkuizengella sp. SCS-71B]|uniref:DUF3048 domain-containing protein n=1 Tax=Chengkuizengella sp. SCS-71B TaxID=3115290 RepID=UPI0032C22054